MWESASRSDLILLRRAIREGWAIPEDRRQTLPKEIAVLLRSDNPRLAIGAARVYVEMDRANLKAEWAAHRLRKASKQLPESKR
jgi:hypothetical protein